ncbi:hypothetical protein Ndes2437B_g07855 [Nannochloris sp. 'desiccata']
MEALTAADFQINHILIDIKIALGALACIVACIGQFYPGKLPDTFYPVLACVVSYFTLSLALTVYTTFIEKDTIAQTRGKADLIIRSKMPRFQDVYTLGIRPQGSKADSAEEVKLASSVGSYFDSEGVLAVDLFKAEVSDLLERLLAASSSRGEAKKSQ